MYIFLHMFFPNHTRCKYFTCDQNSPFQEFSAELKSFTQEHFAILGYGSAGEGWYFLHQGKINHPTPHSNILQFPAQHWKKNNDIARTSFHEKHTSMVYRYIALPWIIFLYNAYSDSMSILYSIFFFMFFLVQTEIHNRCIGAKLFIIVLIISWLSYVILIRLLLFFPYTILSLI